MDLVEIFKRNEKSFLGVGRYTIHMQWWKYRNVCPNCNASGLDDNGDCLWCGMFRHME